MTTKRFVDYFDKDHNYIIQDLQNEDEYQVGFVNCDEDVFLELINQLSDENEHLKQDNNALIHLLENQSMIIEELHFKLLEYQVKEPIALTKKDLELMDKAISYYTHGRCGE